MAYVLEAAVPKHSQDFNGLLSTSNLGSYRVRVDQIQFGLDITTTQGEAKTRAVLYPSAYESGSFSLVLHFMDWAEREKFNTWLQTYMEKTVNGHGFNATMHVSVPVRKFSRIAVPEDSVEFGEGVQDVGYQSSVSFIGVVDPTDPKSNVLNSGVSYFKWPQKDKQSRHFYPAGVQVSGAANLEGTIFDTTPDPTVTSSTNATTAEHQLGITTGDLTQDDAGTGIGDFQP